MYITETTVEVLYVTENYSVPCYTWKDQLESIYIIISCEEFYSKPSYLLKVVGLEYFYNMEYEDYIKFF